MIVLPANYMDQLYVEADKRVVIFHFVNAQGQYFTSRYSLDPAFSWDQHIEKLRNMSVELQNKGAYELGPDLSTRTVMPENQDWKPAALVGDNLMSIKQYEVHARLVRQEDAKQREQQHNG